MNHLYKVALLAILIILVTSCSASNHKYDEALEEISRTSSSELSIPEDRDILNYYHNELEGTLHITSFWDYHMGERIREFKAIHPNVEIVWDGLSKGEMDVETKEEYSRRVSVMLMSGNAGDLIDLSEMSCYRYAKSGLLYNFYSLMDSDQSFDIDDYYTNIFKAMEYNNGLYIIPFVFNYDMMYVSKPIADKIGFNISDYNNINYIQMLDIYHNAKSIITSDTFNLIPSVSKEFFFSYEFHSFYDANKGEAWFNSRNFLDYLNVTNQITPMDYFEFERVTHGNDEFMESQFLFSVFNSNALDVHNYIIDYKNTIGPIPYVSANGDYLFNTLKASYSIPQNSENKDLAWEFIKFCISEREPPASIDVSGIDYENYMMWYEGWIPININNFYNLFQYSGKIELSRLIEGTTLREGDLDNILNDALNQVHLYNLQRNKQASDFDIYQLTNDILLEYYYEDTLTAEQAASLIQDKVILFLNE